MIPKPFTAVFFLIGVVPTLTAQQYCMSGSVTSVQACNGCSFEVGDPVAVSFNVKAGSISCITGECSANGTFTVNMGTRYWQTQSGDGNPTVGIGAISLPTSASSRVVLSGDASLSPTPSMPPTDDQIKVSFEFSAASNLLSSGTLPASLPLPGSVQSPSFSVSSATAATANISYTGQTCAKAPAPIGSFDIPTNGQTGVVGAVNVGGWALSTIPVTVQLWRKPVPNETAAANGLVFIQNTTFVSGARPDIASAYPGYLNSAAAGWGAQLLTNELPNSSGSGTLGNGSYTLHALATDANGLITDLGAHTITVNNATSLVPFGTIDTPANGATISGTAYVNFGWVLTPEPNDIPTNGLTITVYIDNQPAGHPVYNNPRADIQTLFPGYANTNGAVGYFYINTTTLTNGLHTIAWSVTDNAGHASGIGSRYFTVQN